MSSPTQQSTTEPVRNILLHFCNWLWSRREFIGGTLVLGIILNLLASWLSTPSGSIFSDTPLGTFLGHPFIAAFVGISLLLLTGCLWLINLRFPSPVSQSPSTYIPTEEDRETLVNLLSEDYKGRLEQSLGATRITLRLHERTDLTRSSAITIFHGTVGGHNFPLPPDYTIIQAYDKAITGLLVVGEPGAGKTVSLLELAGELLSRSKKDPQRRIPVILNLASWTIHKPPLATWIVDQLRLIYSIPSPMGRAWLEQDKLVVLLDGLDEVSASLDLCIDAINTYREQGKHLVPLVVSSRTEEYMRQNRRLALPTAIEIQPLGYVQTRNKLQGSIRQALQKNTVLQQLMNTPLMFKIVSLTYQDTAVRDLPKLGSFEDQRKLIFEHYVDWQLKQRETKEFFSKDHKQSKTKKNFSSQQIIHGVSWLAQIMTQYNQNPFYIELLQMEWLPGNWLRWLYPSIGVGLAYGLFFSIVKGVSYAFMSGADQYGYPFTPLRGIIDGLLIGLLNTLLFVLFNGIIFGVLDQYLEKQAGEKTWLAKLRDFIRILATRPAYGILNGLPNGLLIGLLVDPPAGLYNGLFCVLIYAILGRLTPGIQATEMLRWSWKSIRENFIVFMVSCTFIGLLYGLLTEFYWQSKKHFSILSPDRFFPCLLFGLSIGLVLGLLGVLMSGFSHEKLTVRDRPNQGIWNALRHSTLLGLLSWLLVGLAFGIIYSVLFPQIFYVFNVPSAEYIPYFPKINAFILGITYGLIVGTCLWLRNGGTTCIQHFAVRLLLWQMEGVPWKLPQFLDEATKTAFLHKEGGGYVFLHSLLQEHFKSLPPS